MKLNFYFLFIIIISYLVFATSDDNTFIDKDLRYNYIPFCALLRLIIIHTIQLTYIKMAYVRRTSIAQKFQDIGKEGIMKYTL